MSLYLGHRISVDIDLFTDQEYGTVEYGPIETYLKNTFPFVSGDFGSDPVNGKSYLVGENKDDVVKLDIFYAAEPFIRETVLKENVRLASVDDIVAMKIDVVRRDGRKKDFWDIHELLNQYSASKMIELHEEGFPWQHDRRQIVEQLTNFDRADEDFDPVCLRNKEWVFIKEDIEEIAESLK